MRAHTHPSPRRASPKALGLNSLQVPRGCPEPLGIGRRSLPSQPPSGPLPRLPRGPLTQSASSQPPNPAGQGHDLPPPGARSSAPRTSPNALWLSWNPGPRERTRAAPTRGPQTLARPRKGLWLLEKLGPPPSRPLHPEAWGSRIPQQPSARGQANKGRTVLEERELGWGKVPTSQRVASGRSPQEREARAALARARRSRARGGSRTAKGAREGLKRRMGRGPG